MTVSQACYRKLGRYKYQLMQDFAVGIGIRPDSDVDLPFIRLTADGDLTVRDRYAWDGPSGPTIDTRTFMRASLVHDALYQLMRERALDHAVHRKPADQLLREMCVADGMWRFRAWYAYVALRLFGGKNARPRDHGRDEVVCAP